MPYQRILITLVNDKSSYNLNQIEHAQIMQVVLKNRVLNVYSGLLENICRHAFSDLGISNCSVWKKKQKTKKKKQQQQQTKQMS